MKLNLIVVKENKSKGILFVCLFEFKQAILSVQLVS